MGLTGSPQTLSDPARVAPALTATAAAPFRPPAAFRPRRPGAFGFWLAEPLPRLR